MRCDLFRLCYLVALGGFYLDADEDYQGVDCSFLFRDDRLKVASLCYDRDADDMVPAATFADPAERSPSWTYYVNNNPLVAPPGHPVLVRALARALSRLGRGEDLNDVQETTGPGNLTASLVAHVMSNPQHLEQDCSLLINWNAVSVSRWPLSYRSDERNWRLWERSHQ